MPNDNIQSRLFKKNDLDKVDDTEESSKKEFKKEPEQEPELEPDKIDLLPLPTLYPNSDNFEYPLRKLEKVTQEEIDISLPKLDEIDPDVDIVYEDEVELPSDPWTVCTAQCYTQRVLNSIGLYGIALSFLFTWQLRSTRRREPQRAQRLFFLWPLALASACDHILQSRCMEWCEHLRHSHISPPKKDISHPYVKI